MELKALGEDVPNFKEWKGSFPDGVDEFGEAAYSEFLARFYLDALKEVAKELMIFVYDNPSPFIEDLLQKIKNTTGVKVE